MFIVRVLVVYEISSLYTQFRIAVEGKHHGLSLKKTGNPYSSQNVRDVNAKNGEQNEPSDVGTTVGNLTNKMKVKETGGRRRGFESIGEYFPHFVSNPVNQIIERPLYRHHVHFVPKPYPVVSVRYVPKPFPIPYPVPSHVHVSHLHLRPKCKYKMFVVFILILSKQKNYSFL